MSTLDALFGDGFRLAGRPRRTAVAVLLGGIALLVAGILVVRALTGEEQAKGGKVAGSSADSFTLTYPNGWQALPKERLNGLAGHPLAVLRRKDGKGFVVLRKEKRAPRNFTQFSADLTRLLRARVPDFQKQSSRIVKIRAGTAFFYSYIRRRAGTVHAVVLVPAGASSYALNTVSGGGRQDVARQIAKIILSFDLKPRG